MKSFTFDMFQTLGLAAFMLYVGSHLKKRIPFLERFCIPSPVVGGLLFAVCTCILYAAGIIEFSFDDTLKNVFMVAFFTSVGFSANAKVLKKGGTALVLFLICASVLVILQNMLAVGLADVLQIDPLIGLCTGSIPMVGGHGVSGAFGPVLEDLGLTGASTICTAAATFGLIGGSLMGGPLGQRLIQKKDLLNKMESYDESFLEEEEENHSRATGGYASAANQLALAMGLGTIVSWLLSLTGIAFPVYIGSMITAVIMRNLSEYTGRGHMPVGEINVLGGICMNLFLGIAMISMKLWQLASLALPLIVLLAGQTVLMFLFAYFVVFNVMGRNYDAAMLSAGICGFGMGATPNAMANMQVLTEKYAPSVKAYIIVPIVGGMFIDFVNSLVITFFINLV